MMNKIALSLVCCAFALFGYSAENHIGDGAGSVESKRKFKTMLDRKVERQLMFTPGVEIASGKADVLIQVVNGRVEVLNIWGVDADAAGYITARLNEIVLPSAEHESGEMFRYRILFTSQN